jgi:hypothetical protein
VVGTGGRHPVAARLLGALCVASLVCACSGDDAAGRTTSVTLVAADCAARTPTLRVDLVDDAIAAVETQLGGLQQYFEINATDLLVNLFVAVDDATKAQPFVFLQDELNSQEPKAAEGNTFAASAVDFDPQTVTSCVADELPQSQATAFEVLGGPGGAVGYSVIVNSPEGGQLVVAVDGDGHVLSVDPV